MFKKLVITLGILALFVSPVFAGIALEQGGTNKGPFHTINFADSEVAVSGGVATITIDALQDADGDTKIQLEESADEDIIRIDIAGTEKVTIEDTGDGSPATTAINQTDTGAGRPVLKLTQQDPDEDFIDFVGNSSSDGSKSISSDTGTAGSKNGAIKVEINGTTHWLRLYDAHN